MSLRQLALALVVLTALVAIATDWARADLALAWRIPAGLLLAGLTYEAWWVRRTRIELRANAHANALLGKALRVELEWAHNANRSIDIQFAPDAPASVSLDSSLRALRLPPNLSVRDELNVTPRQLGVHQWPALSVRIAGPLHLAWWPRRIRPEFAIKVLPNLLQTSEHRLVAQSGGQVARRTTGSGAEIVQLRDYRPGDSMRCIDWKATARLGKLISRDFSEDQHLEIIVAIDAGRASRQRCGALDRLGHFANIAARFAEYAVRRDDRIGLVVFADRPLAVLPPSRGVAAVLRMRAVLSAMQTAPVESNPLAAATRIASLVRHRSLVVMLTDLDDATVAGQLAAATRLLLPKHLPLLAGLSSVEADRLARASGESWLDAYHSLAAQEYGLRLQRNVQTLRSLGAPALAVYPDQLERAVFSAYDEFKARHRV